MRKKTTWSILGLGLITAVLYRFRRQLLGRFLRLRPARYEVLVDRALPVVMRDGVALVADHYYPKGKRLFPTILIRTPYGRSLQIGLVGVMAEFAARRFAERGYNVIVQDVRGRFDSGGEFEPFVNEAQDGRATLEWIENQNWFNGMVGMWGQSYLGYTQWAVASRAPLYLKALVPAMTGTRLPIAGFYRGALGMDTLYRWMYELDAMDRQESHRRWRALWRLNPRLQERKLQRAFRHLPLREADRLLVGKPIAYYQKWLEHPSITDPYWQSLDFQPGLAQVAAAVHFISGWYDVFLPELLADYQIMKANGQEPYLTIGPYSHLDLEGALENLRQGITWFDATLKGDRHRLRPSPVRIFVMSANGGTWRELPSWPPPSLAQPYYLQPEGSLATEMAPAQAAPDEYRYDPAHPTPSSGGALLSAQAGPVDNRPLEARPDVLTFTSAPLEADLEAIGPVQLVLYVKSSSLYTDIFGRLCDVYPDGRSINLSDGLLRLVPESGEFQPDGIRRIVIPLCPTAASWLQGHRLRLQVSSGAYPRWNRNPGTGEPQAVATELIPVDQVIYHDADHPSAVILPIV